MSAPIKRLFRSRDHAQIAGVCHGVAEYLAIDPVVVRLVTVVVTFLTGIVPGILAYIAGWILVPLAPQPVVYQAPPSVNEGSPRTT